MEKRKLTLVHTNSVPSSWEGKSTDLALVHHSDITGKQALKSSSAEVTFR